MLQKADKFAPLAVTLIFLYLTYTSATEKSGDASGEKNIPKITKRMLKPEFISVSTRSSPVGRDPFEVSWASYLNGAGVYGVTTNPAEGSDVPASMPSTTPASMPSTSPATLPSRLVPPDLPRAPDAIFIGESFSMAVIGNVIYKEGSLIGGKSPQRCWRLEKIQQDRIIVSFGRIRRVLKMCPVDGQKERRESSGEVSTRASSLSTKSAVRGTRR